MDSWLEVQQIAPEYIFLERKDVLFLTIRNKHNFLELYDKQGNRVGKDMEIEEITDRKIEKALRYKELLDVAEEAKKRGEKLKFAEECGISITSPNRLKRRYDKETFFGLIDERNGNPGRNKEARDEGGIFGNGSQRREIKSNYL